MSIAGSCIGIEIDEAVIRAVILNAEADKIIGYAEVKRTPQPQQKFERLGVELASLWSKLPEKFTGNVRVAAAFGDVDSGVQAGEDASVWLDALEVKRGTELVRVVLGESIAYSRSDVLASYQQIFTDNEIPLERLELAPQAAARIVNSSGSVTGSVQSGVSWQFLYSNDQLQSANHVPKSETTQLTLREANSQAPVELGYEPGLNVSQGLLDAFGIEEVTLAVCVGAAKGLNTADAHFKQAAPAVIESQIDLTTELDLTQEHEIDVELLQPIDLTTTSGPDTQAGLVQTAQPLATATAVPSIPPSLFATSSSVPVNQLATPPQIVIESQPSERVANVKRSKMAVLILGAQTAFYLSVGFLAGVGIFHIATETTYLDWFKNLF